MLQVEYAELSDAGPVRPHNEDCMGHFAPPSSVEARSHGWLFVLADGVGGQEHGEVASRLAVNAAVREFAAAPGGENLSAVLTRAVQKANTEVYAAGHGSIATTLVACALRYDRAAIAHVGDSRCYLLRRGRLHQLTRDHTVSGDKARIGLLSQREAASASKKNVLSRSLGINLFVSAESSEHEVQAGDTLLLCSDGLHGPVKEKELGRIATASHDLQAVARKLVEVANQLDGGDNVSVQLIRILDIERVGMYRGRPYRLR
jgi:protein phosphatase